VHDDLKAVEERFMRAVAARDLDYLEAHLAPEFKLVTGRPGHEMRERAEWLAVTAESYVIEEFSFDELDVVELGDVAVVRSRYRQRGSMDGADRSQPFLMTDVWRRDGEEWRLVTRHISPLPG
jgi:ketosteroid isomerase-like protein